jgi:hypothetical protein
MQMQSVMSNDPLFSVHCFYRFTAALFYYLHIASVRNFDPIHAASTVFIDYIQSWAFATFFPFRYSLIRYFNVAIRYRYSATFQKFLQIYYG